MKMRLQLIDPMGQVQDEIDLFAAVGADIYRPSSGQRMRIAAEHLANQAMRYAEFEVMLRPAA
jgi:hypothetical protein